jgi:ribonuclease VapC
VIDTSALLAILRDEPEAAACAEAIATASRCRISAANFVEAAIIVDAGRDPVASRRFDDLIAEAGLVIEAGSGDRRAVVIQRGRFPAHRHHTGRDLKSHPLRE